MRWDMFVTLCALGGQWLTMDPSGLTFGTLRLRLGSIWNAWELCGCLLGSFCRPLDLIQDALGS